MSAEPHCDIWAPWSFPFFLFHLFPLSSFLFPFSFFLYFLFLQCFDQMYVHLDTLLWIMRTSGNNGTIDGQGKVWWSKQKSGNIQYTRGRLIQFMWCKDLEISHITVRNSPFWTIHPYDCGNVTIRGVTILNPVDSPNTDGIDPGMHWKWSCHGILTILTHIIWVCLPYDFNAWNGRLDLFSDALLIALLVIVNFFLSDSCRNVLIEDCYISVGDDCIAIKSGWDQYGISYGRASSNIVIRNIIAHSPVRYYLLQRSFDCIQIKVIILMI